MRIFRYIILLETLKGSKAGMTGIIIPFYREETEP